MKVENSTNVKKPIILDDIKAYLDGEKERGILKQKEVAKEVLNKLQACDPNCILAGGAPRNWFFGKEANDLDFYIHLKDETISANEVRFKSIGLDLKMMDFESKSDKEFTYQAMEHLFRVYEGEYKGQKIQVMCMSEKTFTSVIPCFGVSICKFWWNGHYIQADNSAYVSIIAKKLFIEDDYTAKERHVFKMMEYFPEYEVMSYNMYTEVLFDVFCLLRQDNPNADIGDMLFNTLLKEMAIKTLKGE